MIKIFDDIALDLEAIKNLIKSLLKDKDILVKDSYGYLAEHTGKMIRPSLVVVAGMLCNKFYDKNIQKMAAVIELLHIASLVHDDVIDQANMRRGHATISHLKGNKYAVIIGDIIISESFKLLCSLGNIDIANEVAICASSLSEGEIIQDNATGNIDLTLNDYIKIIDKKTASLFVTSMKIPFIFFNQDTAKIENLARLIGVIFQLSDDVLDYSSHLDRSGKNKYNDFLESKVTLPIILLKQHINEQQNQRLKQIFFEKNNKLDNLQYVNNLILQYNIIDKCHDYINQNYILVSKNKIMEFKDNEISQLLIKTIDFIIQRDY